MQKPNAKGPDVIPETIPEDDPAFMDHIDDTVGIPGFYKDQNGLTRWRITAGEGEVLASADRGFASEEEAKADFDEQVKNNTLPALKVFQPQNAASGVQRDEEGEPLPGSPTNFGTGGTVIEPDGEPQAQQNAKPDVGIASGARASSRSSKIAEEDYTLDELREMASKADIEGRSSMGKAELVKALNKQ